MAASQRSFLPVLKAMLPRWAMMVARWPSSISPLGAWRLRLHAGGPAAQAVRADEAGFVTHDEAGVLVGGLEDIRDFPGVFEAEAAGGGGHGARRVHPHDLVHAVETVRSEIRDVAPGVIPEPAIGGQKALAVVRDQRGRAQVEVPIEAFGGSGVGFPADASVAGAGPDSGRLRLVPACW